MPKLRLRIISDGVFVCKRGEKMDWVFKKITQIARFICIINYIFLFLRHNYTFNHKK